MRRNRRLRTAFGAAPVVLMLAHLTAMPVAAQDSAAQPVVLPSDRTVLPISEPQYPHSTVFDARNAKPPPRFEVKAPANAPNVLIAMFPFRDGVDTGAEAGASAIIQPGGSIRDHEVIAAADEYNIAMVFTGMRHFRH